MDTSQRGWRQDKYSLTWAHPSGLTVFVDPQPTISGAIRCIGPFSIGDKKIGRQALLGLLAGATLRIEEATRDHKHFVVWGTHRTIDPIANQSLPLLGPDYYFTPNIALRSEVLHSARGLAGRDALHREWIVSTADRKAIHRSGASFTLAGTSVPQMFTIQVGRSIRMFDSALFNKSTATIMLQCLALTAVQLLGEDSYIDAIELSDSIVAGIESKHSS